jgi:hypothetical protein
MTAVITTTTPTIDEKNGAGLFLRGGRNYSTLQPSTKRSVGTETDAAELDHYSDDEAPLATSGGCGGMWVSIILLFDENHPVVLYQYLIYYKIPSRNTTMSGMTNLDYSNVFRLISSHHQADIRMKQSGCPHNIYYKCCANIYFNRQCLSRKLIPKYSI